MCIYEWMIPNPGLTCKTIVAFALFVAAVWLALAVYQFVSFMLPTSTFRDIWVELIELTVTLPIVCALTLIVCSIVFLKKADSWSSPRKGTWTGAVGGGSLSFLIAGFTLVRYVLSHDRSILTDGEFWWGTWFLPVFVTALPAILIGGSVGALLGWKLFEKR